MANEITNSDDIIDSRDVIARIEELQADRDGFVIGAPDGTETAAPDQWAEEYPDDAAELEALEALASEAEDYAPDWTCGACLIRESYFEEYMDDMLEDIGELPKNLPPYLTITVDYDALRMDYTEVDFDGVTYLVR